MKICAVICECNPFHDGHAYLFSKIRDAGATCIIAIMSGNTVQRGEPAITDKYTRAACALHGGADLVLELPFPYSSASGEKFASAGTFLAASVGADTLAFGSESADLSALERAAQITLQADFVACYRDMIRNGIGTAAAWESAYQKISGESLPGGANDLLAISYLAAIKRNKLPLTPFAVKRIGANDRDTSSLTKEESYPSAGSIRSYIFSKNQIPSVGIPAVTVPILQHAQEKGLFPVSADDLFSLAFPILRLRDSDSLSAVADGGNGVSARLIDAAKNSCNAQELIQQLQAKHLPLARLRRFILFATIGVTNADLCTPPSYTTLLAASANGRKHLATLRRNNTVLPIVTKPSDLPHNLVADRQTALRDAMDALFTLAMPQKKPADWFYKCAPTIL